LEKSAVIICQSTLTSDFRITLLAVLLRTKPHNIRTKSDRSGVPCSGWQTDIVIIRA